MLLAILLLGIFIGGKREIGNTLLTFEFGLGVEVGIGFKVIVEVGVGVAIGLNGLTIIPGRKGLFIELLGIPLKNVFVGRGFIVLNGLFGVGTAGTGNEFTGFGVGIGLKFGAFIVFCGGGLIWLFGFGIMLGFCGSGLI